MGHKKFGCPRKRERERITFRRLLGVCVLVLALLPWHCSSAYRVSGEPGSSTEMRSAGSSAGGFELKVSITEVRVLALNVRLS